MLKRFSSLLLFTFIFLFSFAQVREIPTEVREKFRTQYQGADSIEFRDQIVKVFVHFTKDSARYIAEYSNKGEWKGTEKMWEFNKLPEDVKDGFGKSKYADWDIEDTRVIYKTNGTQQYRIKVGKSDLQKKYLYFNEKGRLKRDAVTI